MKKGLISVLGTALLALAGSSFANAPIIQGVPDVVIGDAEDNGQTLDANFFIHANAFNIMDYVTDADASSTPAVLKFAFDEVGTGDPAAGGDINNITINDKTQIDPTALPGAWGANAIQGVYLFSFRDILRSPSGSGPFPDPTLADGTTLAAQGDLLPWSTGASTKGGDARVVQIFVADETDNVASDTINVYSMEDSADALSGTFTTIFSDTTFAAANWAYSSFTGYAAATAGGGTGGGFVGLGAGATGTGGAFVGRWALTGTGFLGSDYPIDSVDASLIYRGKFTLALQSAATKSAAPGIRFGAEDAFQLLVTTNRVFSENASQAEPIASNIQTHIPAVGSALDYNVYWKSGADYPEAANLNDFNTGSGTADLNDFKVFFDVVDVDTASDAGEWRLTGVEVGTLERPAAGATTTVTDFSAAGGWASGGPAAGGASVSGTATGATFTGTATLGSYALWQKLNIATWTAGKVLRVSASLSTPDTTARGNIHQIRLRTQTGLLFLAQEFQIRGRYDLGEPITGSYVPPVGTPQVYETYVPMYGGAAAELVSAGLDKFNFSLDEINDVPGTAATSWTCSQVIFDVIDDPMP